MPKRRITERSHKRSPVTGFRQNRSKIGFSGNKMIHIPSGRSLLKGKYRRGKR